MDSFILYHSHVMTLSLLSGDECQKALLAIDNYITTGKMPETDGRVKTAIEAIIPTLNKAINRYEAAKENGKKGGRPKTKTQSKPEPKPEVKPEPKPNRNQNRNLNPNLSLSSSSSLSLSSSSQERDPPPEKDITARVESLRQFWEKCKLPPAQIITNPIILDSVKDSLKTFSDEKIAKSISNYAELVNRPGFDESVLPGGKRTNFQNFLKRWIDRFTEEAEPFKNFRQTGPPKDDFDISTPKEEL